MAKQAILLLGFGGPESSEEIRPFILDVVKGRNVPAARIDQVCRQYLLIGGKSPYNQLIAKQKQALESLLVRKNCALPVYLGLLHAHPKVADTAKEIENAGIEEIAVVIMAPHPASHGKYKQALADALSDKVKCHYLNSWHHNPKFISAISARAKAALGVLEESESKEARFIFTAHSIPAGLPYAQAYALEVGQTAELLALALGTANWRLAFQSRSGNPREAWLEPDIGQAIIEAKNDGAKNVVVVPIGFVCDHTEVLFDLDIQAREIARKEGIGFLRAATVQDDGQFIDMLFGLAGEKLLLPV